MPKLVEISSSDDLMEIKGELMDYLKELINKNPKLVNFYKLLYQKIDNYLSSTGSIDIEIFKYLS